MFIEEYLQDLRRDRYRPGALVHYARRSLGRAREGLVANPGGVRSVWSVALGFFIACFVAALAIAVWVDRHLAYDYFLCTSLTLLPTFTLVTAHLELLRDREGFRLSALNVPTVLTLLRLGMAPGLVLFLVRGRYDMALAAFLLAELSDVLDGFLARRWNQITRLGTVVDPIVDILFNSSVLCGLAAGGVIPPWVLAAGIARYALLLVGGASLYVLVGPVRIQPTAFGRFSGVVMGTLFGFLVLLHNLHGVGWAERVLPLTTTALGALLCVAVGQALGLGWYNLRVMHGETQARGRVVGDVRWGPR